MTYSDTTPVDTDLVPAAQNEVVRRAVRLALMAGVTAATATAISAPAAAQEAATAEEVDTVVVTGSRIRRVDAETASPILTVTAEDIAKTGLTTLGDVLQRLPVVSGAATNPTVNNGGGFGESNVELRGLGAQRTLVLIDGRRVGVYGNTTTSAVDVNIIPVNMIERVEVLKEGAGAVYGSDAIAGVVNFITRRNFEGAEVNVQYGATGESDGDRRSASATLGTQGEKLSVVFGANYNKQDKVSAGDRAFSATALYLYGGVVSAGGSSRTTTGRIRVPGVDANGDPCGSVTRIAGSSGASTADYRCFEGSDLYNYQPFNLLVTPQERGSLFTDLNYQLSDDVEMYGQVVYNQTRSGFQIAPLPFDAVADDTVISADSFYNPFGTDFGGVDGLNPNAQVRLEALGNRASRTTSDSTFANLGFRGELAARWQWDLNAGFGHLKQDQNIAGYLLKTQLVDCL